MAYDLIAVVNDNQNRVVIASPATGEWTALDGDDVVAIAKAHGLAAVGVPDGMAIYSSADEILTITDARGEITTFRVSRDALAVMAEYFVAKASFGVGAEIYELRELAYQDADEVMRLVYEMQLELI